MEDVALSGTLEDYLEAICRLEADNGSARPGDIAKALFVHKSTVTAALRSLSDKGLIYYSPYEAATLTLAGHGLADEIIRSHEVIRRFLAEVLQIAPELAETNACRIEHAIDPDVLDRLLEFIRFVQKCPRSGSYWLRGFANYCKQAGDPAECERCLRQCLDEFRSSRTIEPCARTNAETAEGD